MDTQEYDALNRIRKALYPTDNASQRKEMEPTYNKGGALKAVKVDGTNYVEEIAYNARGQRLLLAMGNGMMTRYAYDPETFRVVRTKSEKFIHSGLTYTPDGGVQQDLAYTYDLEGTILSQNDDAPANTSAQGPGGQLREFTHDPLRRLISATGRESSNAYQQPSCPPERLSSRAGDLNIRPEDYTATNTYTRAYSYDKIGNIQTLNHVAAGHANQNFNRVYNYGISFADNRLESFELTSNTYFYQYDSAGNIIQEGANRYYEWTQNDKPATYSNQAGTSDPTMYTNYFYNAAGERVKKHTRKGKQVEVTFYMDGGMFETSYVKPTGGSIDNDRFYNTLHVLDGSSRIATIRVGTDADDPTSPTKYYLEDHTSTSLSAGLMDSLVVLETDGTLINREEFYPFGETSFGGFAKKRYRFNGKEKDEESGLYYYGQRYYAPWLCRFISVDPIAESYPQLSSYNYAGNKPITHLDIEGLQSDGGDENLQMNPQSGDAVFDQVANKVVNDYGGMNNTSVTITVHQVEGEFVGGSISVTQNGETTTANYSPSEGFIDASTGASLSVDENQELIPDIAGQSAIAVYDNELRSSYIKSAENGAKSNLSKFDQVADAADEIKIMENSIDERNALKEDVRKKLSPGASKITKALENDAKYTPENLLKDYGKGGEKGTNLEGRELRREIVEASGRSNKLLKGFSKVGRALGWAGLIVGITLSAIDIANDPSTENIAEEAGSFAGGAIGATIGTALFVGAAIAFGIATGGVGLLVIGIVGSMVGGFAGGYAGGKMGRASGRSIENAKFGL